MFSTIPSRIAKAFPGATPPPAWSPADLPGAYIWFRADSGITTTGGLVDTWTDIINGKILTNATSDKFSYNSSDVNFNGQPSIQYNKSLGGNPQLLNNNISFNGGNLFNWCVYLMSSPRDNEQMYSDLYLSNGSLNIVQFNGNGSGLKNEYLPYGINSGRLVSPYATNLAVPQIFMGQINNSALTYQLWDNRTNPTTGGIITSSISAQTFNFIVGNGLINIIPGYQMNGRIAEVGYAWGAPSAGDLTNLFNYVTSRYNITLS